jgi:putative toxin-antitoxin system antitoxin component (TIGR02293 family)
MDTKTKITEVKKKDYQWSVSIEPEKDNSEKKLFISFSVVPKYNKFYGHSIGLKSGEKTALIKALKTGLPISTFKTLQKEIDVSAKTLAAIINIADRTLVRRKKEGKLKTDESERLFRIARLFDKAIDVLGDIEQARQWFKSSKKALSGSTPLEYADTELGAQEVFDLLGRLEHGVF